MRHEFLRLNAIAIDLWISVNICGQVRSAVGCGTTNAWPLLWWDHCGMHPQGCQLQAQINPGFDFYLVHHVASRALCFRMARGCGKRARLACLVRAARLYLPLACFCLLKANAPGASLRQVGAHDASTRTCWRSLAGSTLPT